MQTWEALPPHASCYNGGNPRNAGSPLGIHSVQYHWLRRIYLKMSKLKEFTVASARPMSVILLADISGSMSVDGKINALNRAIAELIAS